MASITPDTERDESAWAQALAGHPPEGMDPATKRQAELLRAGLQRRKARIDADIEAPNEANFQRLLFRLRQEGLDRPKEALPPHRRPNALDIATPPRAPGDHPAKLLHRRPFAWGIAASVMLATVIIIQQGGFMGSQDDDLVMRSATEKATIRLVDNVTVSRDELVGLLKQAGSEPKVTVVRATGEVVIQVEATQPVRDALAGDPLRIYPEIQDGKITVILKSVKKSN